MQRQALLDAGVPDEAVELIPDEQEAMARALDIAAVGDLVLAFGDDIERSWSQITEYQASETPERALEPERRVEPASDLVPHFTFDGDEELIRDERGVRLAKVVELED